MKPVRDERLDIIMKVKNLVRDDPFIVGMLKRMPPPVAESFTDDQLLEIKKSVGDRKWAAHSIDIRRTLKLLKWKYYFVFIAGRERRGNEVERMRAWTWVNAFFIALFMLGVLAIGIFLVYKLNTMA